MKDTFKKLTALNEYLKQGYMALKYGQVEQAKHCYTQAIQASKEAVASTFWLHETLVTEATDRMARLQQAQKKQAAVAKHTA